MSQPYSQFVNRADRQPVDHPTPWPTREELQLAKSADAKLSRYADLLTPGMLALAKAVAEDDGYRPNSSDDGAAELARQVALGDCGTGAGGFKQGNTCAAGGEGGDDENKRKPGEQHTAKDLKAFKRRVEHEHAQREERIKEIEAADKTPLPDWTKIDGVDVLQVPGSEHAAFPISGKKNGAVFQVFNVKTREPGPQLKKAEIHNWLYRDAERQEIKGRKGFGEPAAK